MHSFTLIIYIALSNGMLYLINFTCVWFPNHSLLMFDFQASRYNDSLSIVHFCLKVSRSFDFNIDWCVIIVSTKNPLSFIQNYIFLSRNKTVDTFALSQTIISSRNIFLTHNFSHTILVRLTLTLTLSFIQNYNIFFVA